jgi:hypothetical protein
MERLIGELIEWQHNTCKRADLRTLHVSALFYPVNSSYFKGSIDRLESQGPATLRQYNSLRE